jgi:hypothetical protein
VARFLDGRDVDEHVLASTIGLDESDPLIELNHFTVPLATLASPFTKKVIERTRFVRRGGGSPMAKSGRWMVTATRHPPQALTIRYRLSLLRIRPRSECLHSLAING